MHNFTCSIYLSKLCKANVTGVRFGAGVNEDVTSKRLFERKFLLTMWTAAYGTSNSVELESNSKFYADESTTIVPVRFFSSMCPGVTFMQCHWARFLTAKATHEALFHRIAWLLLWILFKVSLFRWQVTLFMRIQVVDSFVTLMANIAFIIPLFIVYV